MEEFTTTPPKDILHLLILEKIESVLYNRREYISKINLGAKSWPINSYKAVLDELFMLLYAHLNEELKADDFKLIEDNLKTKEFDKLDTVFKKISIYLKKKRLTDFATKKHYDTTDIESENFEKGL
jgi:hypothetical protein